LPPDGAPLPAVIVEAGFAGSNSAATRLIEQGSVRVDGERIRDRAVRFAPDARPFVLQVGKRRVARVVPGPPRKKSC
jgi:tyrosyl-tRNA synthetase